MRIYLVLLLSMSLCLPSFAESSDEKDRYSFSVSARGQADNDWMVVVLSIQHQDKDLSRAADQVNKDMQWALEQVDGALDIKSSTEGYNSSAIYNDNSRTVRSWRVSQQLRLQSSNFDGLREKLQRLQKKMAVQHMRFSIKPDTRDLLIEDLMVQALSNVQRRAKLIAHQMNAQDFSVVHAQILNNDRGRQTLGAEVMMHSRVASAVSMPAVSGGESDVVVSVQAEIELQY